MLLVSVMLLVMVHQYNLCNITDVVLPIRFEQAYMSGLTNKITYYTLFTINISGRGAQY